MDDISEATDQTIATFSTNTDSRMRSLRVADIESCILWWKECSMVSEPHSSA